MAEKKSRGKSSGKGGILSVVLVVWLILLTGAGVLFVLFINNPKEGNLENRLARLESRKKVVRKVKPVTSAAGADQDALQAVEGRLVSLEQQMKKMGAAPVPRTPEKRDTTSVSGTCQCDDLLSRLDKLESAMLAKAVAKPVVAKAKPRKKKKKIRRRRKKVAKRPVPASRKTVPAVSAARPKEAPVVTYRSGLRYEDNYSRESIYDMTRRLAPIYSYNGQETNNLSTLAPGAAIYPDYSNSYINRSLSN